MLLKPVANSNSNLATLSTEAHLAATRKWRQCRLLPRVPTLKSTAPIANLRPKSFARLSRPSRLPATPKRSKPTCASNSIPPRS
ncbi:hypothetical protein BC567DRAFT_222701 [Phyllosticta citribraziliensis]